MSQLPPETEPRFPSNLGFSDRELGIFGLLAAIVLARIPSLLIAPRFWAEDGTVYFAYARQHGLLESLLLVPTTSGPAGYLNLAANLPAWLAARWLPLEWAPLVPTAFALLIQLIPIALVLHGHIPAFPRPLQRRLAATLMVVSPPLLSEIWGNATNSQIFLGMAAALILWEDPAGPGPRGHALRAGILLLACLSGPYSLFLAPFFIAKAVFYRWPRSFGDERASRAGRMAIFVGSAALFQAGVYLWTLGVVGMSDRALGGGPLGARLAAILHADLLQGIFGEQAGTAIARLFGLLPAIDRVTGSGASDAHLVSAGWLSLGLLLAFALWLGSGSLWIGNRSSVGTRAMAALPVISAAWISLVVGLAVGPLVTVERYSALPGVLWLLALVAIIGDPHSFSRRWISRLAVAWALVSGAAGFYQEVPASSLGLAEGRPDWQEEVGLWQEDSEQLLRIWPYAEPEPWYLFLPTEASEAVGVMRSSRPTNLISTGGWQSLSWPADGLRGDFKIVLRFMASQSSIRLHLRLEDAEGEPLVVLRPGSFPSERTHRWILERHDRRLADIDMNEVSRLTLAMKPEHERPTRVLVQDLYIGPRIEGALEPSLPGGWPTETDANERLPLDGWLALSSVLAPTAFPPGMPSMIGWIVLLLLAGSMAGNGAPWRSGWRVLFLPLLFLGASSICVHSTEPGPEPLLMLLLFWPLAAWVRGAFDVDPSEAHPPDIDALDIDTPDTHPPTGAGTSASDHGSAEPRARVHAWWVLLLAGFSLGLVAARLPIVWLFVALPVGEWLWRLRERSGRRSKMVGLGLTLAGLSVAMALDGLMAADETHAGSTAIPGARAPGDFGSWAESAWHLGFGPEGWLGLFPLAFLALALTLFGPAANFRKTLLLGALLAANGLLLASRTSVDALSLGPTSALLATLYPLFWLLPEDWASRERPRAVRWAWIGGLIVFLIYTLPSLERAAASEDQRVFGLEPSEASVVGGPIAPLDETSVVPGIRVPEAR